MAYLKDIIAANSGTPIDFEFLSRSDVQSGQGKKGPYQFYDYTFLTRSNGKPHTEKIFVSDYANGDDKKLAMAVKGQLCRASLNEKGYVKWELLPMGPESAYIPPVSPTRQVAAERAVTNADTLRESRDNLRDWRMGLAGITQAMLIRGAPQKEITGEDGQQMTAPDWTRWIRRKSEELANPVASEIIPTDLPF